MRGKPCYEDYANRALRFYTRNPDICLMDISEIDAQNWRICDAVCRILDKRDFSAIMEIYQNRCQISDAVSITAQRQQRPEQDVWDLLRAVAKLFAEKRGLI
ncbi:MAG: hypothetical protein J6N18_01445 [Kiritimatiellae bacterium]|nr:hypothetical protein [Kiritimatiellia bacterium]